MIMATDHHGYTSPKHLLAPGHRPGIGRVDLGAGEPAIARARGTMDPMRSARERRAAYRRQSDRGANNVVGQIP